MDYENIIVSQDDGVGLVTFNRPKALNALNALLVKELNAALSVFAADPQIGCVVLTGSEKAFAAGADVKELQTKSYPGTYVEDFLRQWDDVAAFRKPMIAAVSGYCLGGGLEFALMCDFIIAADTARFGTPETELGIFPGGGATQRIARFLGKSKAMDMVLTGRQIEAVEAERMGLVARIVPAAQCLQEAMTAAKKIASLSQPVMMMAKESVNRAYETTLSEGLRFERRLFHAIFALQDAQEGLAAFTEKRTASFENK